MKTMCDRLFQETHVYDKGTWVQGDHQPINGYPEVLFKLGTPDFPLVGNDATKTKELMESLVATGQYQLSNFDTDILDLFAAAWQMKQKPLQRSSGSMRSVWFIRRPSAGRSICRLSNTPEPNRGILLKTVIVPSTADHLWNSPVVAVEAVVQAETGLGVSNYI